MQEAENNRKPEKAANEKPRNLCYSLYVHYSSDRFTACEMVGTYSLNGGEEKCMQEFGKGT